MSSRFPLAKMDTPMRVLTWICLAIPTVMLAAALTGPPSTNLILIGTSVFVVGLYAFVWFWLRPREFVVDAEGLELVWPMRRRRIPAAAITGAVVLDRAAIKAEFSYLMRIGAGGLWGGFGRAKTARGTLELWVSRIDRMVWVQCTGRRSLLVTPADPERFVAELTSAASTATGR